MRVLVEDLLRAVTVMDVLDMETFIVESKVKLIQYTNTPPYSPSPL